MIDSVLKAPELNTSVRNQTTLSTILQRRNVLAIIFEELVRINIRPVSSVHSSREAGNR